MRILLIYAHPCEESFVSAVKETAVRTLSARGHEVRVLDLYALGFDPVLSAQGRRDYHSPGANERDVAEHLANLRWAEGLVFVHPTWWYGPPAILKGWLERVWVPHATFTMPEPRKPIGPVLTNIRLVGQITTLGSPRWWWWLMGMPGRRIIMTGLSALCARSCRKLWLGHYRMDSSTPESRARFLSAVERRLAGIR